jgi:hypothetical protein
MTPVHIIFSSSLVPTFVVLFLAPFFLFAVLWAIFRLPKLRSTISKLRRHRRELEARRAELASVALELKQKRGADKTPKQPYVLEAENVVEQVPQRPALTINPFLLMLVKPAASIRQIVDFDSQLHVILLSCLYGVNCG